MRLLRGASGFVRGASRVVRRGVARVPISVIALLTLLVVAACAPVVVPYDPDEQHRDAPFAPPTRVHVVDRAGRWHLRPFVEGGVPIRFWVTAATEGLNGLRVTNQRLFGVDEPGRLFLLGTDRYGRDRFSRLLAGARTSLGAGLLAASLSTGLGLLLGGAAGAAGGWLDRLVMRAVEIFIAVPWLYLLLAVRAALPLDVPPGRAFLLLVGVIGVAGWARPARLVRGLVLSGRERGYVEAARACGASNWYVLCHHILPQTLALVATQAAILAPQFTLAEMTLSFFGLGLAEPLASWGTLLADLSRDHLVQPSWYAAAPVAAVVGVFVLYHRVADAVTARSVQVAS